MTIEYAKAYGRELREHAHMKRLQAEAVVGQQRLLHPIRAAIGRSLIALGERLSSEPPGERVLPLVEPWARRPMSGA